MISVWDLPGPAKFLQSVTRSLRDGACVVLRSLGSQSVQFREQVLISLNHVLHCAVCLPEPGISPIECLRERFAPSLSNASDLTPFDLCQHGEFQGRLIWLDSFGVISADGWIAWKSFFEHYFHAIRSVRPFERTLFVIGIEGDRIFDLPTSDVTLEVHDWSNTVDEVDLLMLAYDRLDHRNFSRVMRELLATTVAHVAVWDLEIAERMVTQDWEVILWPYSMLQSFAREKKWTSDTLISLERGTASKSGIRHAGIASLDRPPHEIRRRMWTAQVSVLFPVIDRLRVDIIAECYDQLERCLPLEVDATTDPWELDIGGVSKAMHCFSFDDAVFERVCWINRLRNKLAHLKLLSASELRMLGVF